MKQKKSSLQIIGMVFFLLIIVTVTWGQITQRSKQWLEDLDYVTHEFFSKAVNQLRKKIPSLTDLEISMEIYKMIALIRDGHTYVSMPQDVSSLLHYYPVRFYPFSDGLYIISAEKKHEDSVGKKVVRIGQVSARDAMERLSMLISGDNEMGRLKKIPRYLILAEFLQHVGINNSTEELVLRLADRDGSERIVSLKAKLFPGNYMRLVHDRLFPVLDDSIITINEKCDDLTPLWLQRPDERYWFKYIENQNAYYMQINEMYHKEEEDFDSFCKRLFNLIDEHPSARLIVDVRNNTGGNRIEWPLIREIINRPDLNQPDRIFLLIGRFTFSAAQNLTNYIEKFTNARLVGEPTSGKPNHFGSVVHFTLPNTKFYVSCSVYYYQDSDPDDLRLTTQPDISVPFTGDDYISNRDPVLERVLQNDLIAHLPNLTEVMKQSYEQEGIKGALQKYNEIRKEYMHAGINVEYHLDRLGSWLTWSKENVNHALTIYRRLLRESPNSVEGNLQCGLSLERLGQYSEAKRYYNKCLELHPGHTVAKRRLGLLELESGIKK